jgi:hypothetical protein
MRDHLREELTRNGLNTIKGDALTKRAHNYWAAVTGKDGKTFIFLALINGSPRGGGYGYKDMDEFSGPVEDDCPLKILDLADPLPPCSRPAECSTKKESWEKCSNCWASEFRTRVRAHHAARRAKLALQKTLKPGDKVWLKNVKDNPFTVSSVLPFRGYDVKGYGPYRLPKTRVDRVEAA